MIAISIVVLTRHECMRKEWLGKRINILAPKLLQ